MITLYEYPLSPYVQKVKIALREKEIEEFMDTYHEPINWGLGEINFFGRALAAGTAAISGYQGIH